MTYGGSNVGKSLTISTALMFATVAAMWVVGVTPAAHLMTGLYGWTLWSFPVGLIAGALVFSGLLILGRTLALVGLKTNEPISSVGGALLTVTVFGIFGGGILSFYPKSIWVDGLLITGVLVTLLATYLAYRIVWLGIGGEGWRKVSNRAFLISGVAYVVGAGIAGFNGTIGGFIIAAAVLGIIVGWVADLGHELYEVRQASRTVGANGFAVYVAVAGVFVHVMQFVLEFLASGDS